MSNGTTTTDSSEEDPYDYAARWLAKWLNDFAGPWSAVGIDGRRGEVRADELSAVLRKKGSAKLTTLVFDVQLPPSDSMFHAEAGELFSGFDVTVAINRG